MHRPVCLHYHIFKNAGSTFDDALARVFGDRFQSVDGPHPWSILSSDFLANYLEDRPQVSALSTHQGRFPLPTSRAFRVYAVVFLRDPLDRIGSVYEYERRTPSDAPGPRKAKELTLPDYIRWRLSPEATKVISDFQVSYLAGIQDLFGASPDEADLALASANLNRASVVGVVERFEESIVAAEQVLSEFFPSIDLSYKVRNVSGRASDRRERLARMREIIGEPLFEEISRRNELDVRLLDRANEILDGQIAAIPAVESLLENLRERCRMREIVAS